ncbi:MAG: Rv3654c family TadE-like protein [Actinomycetes bacterium]
MRRDDGSASVMVVGAGALLSALAVAAGLVATGLTAHRQAVRAADLAALAGAQRSLVDVTVACEAARVVAVSNGAELTECSLEPSALRVEVSVPTVGVLPMIVATSRAGVRLS